jgi:hypothetical protein
MECVPSLSCGAGWQGAFVWAAAEPLVRYLGALDCWVRAPGAVWERCSQSIARLQTNLSRRRVHAFLKSARAQAQSVLRWRDLARSECRLLNPGILCPSRFPISPIETAVACLPLPTLCSLWNGHGPWAVIPSLAFAFGLRAAIEDRPFGQTGPHGIHRKRLPHLDCISYIHARVTHARGAASPIKHASYPCWRGTF